MKSEPEKPHAFLDIETLGSTAGCAIVQVALMRLWPVSGARHEPLVITFDKQQMLDLGFHQDPDTLAWWAEQDPALRAVVMGGKTIPAVGAARIFNWFQNHGPFEAVWCKGASFDFPILSAFLSRFFQTPAWEFRSERCFRTLQQIHDPAKELRPAPFPGHMPHHAGDDVLQDARWLIAITKQIEEAKRVKRLLAEISAPDGDPRECGEAA